MWAEAPVADVGIACEEHYHLVLDISGNRELMEGHTKAGQFVQVTPLVPSINQSKVRDKPFSISMRGVVPFKICLFSEQWTSFGA